MPLIKKPIAQKTTISNFKGVPTVAGTPIEDLQLCRRLCQQQIDQGDIVNGAIFAIAAAKTIKGAVDWGLRSNELLLKPAVMRVAQHLIDLMAETVKDAEAVDKITSQIALEIEGRISD